MKWIVRDGRVVIPGFLMMLIMGSVYSYSVFRLPIETYFQVTSSLSGLPYMLSLFFYAVFMGISGKILEKTPAFKVIIIGVLFISLGWFIAFLSKNFFLLSMGYGIFIGSGIGFIYGVPLMIISDLYPNKKGLYFGIVLFGFGLSPLISAPILQWLVTQYDLHTTFLIMSVFTLIVLTLLSLFYRKYNIKKSSLTLTPFKSTLKQPRYQLLYITFFIGTFIGLTVIGFTSTYAAEVLKYTLGQAALFVSLFAIFNGLGRVIFGYLTDKLQIHLIMFLSFTSLLMASLLIVFVSHSPVIFVLSFSIIWMNLGGWLAIAPSATAQLFGKETYTRNYGILFSAYGFSAILGVYIAGVLSDLLGGYQVTFILFAILALIGIGMSRLFRKINLKSE
jgi:MFS family permease